jgi:hypothetical protein
VENDQDLYEQENQEDIALAINTLNW